MSVQGAGRGGPLDAAGGPPASGAGAQVADLVERAGALADGGASRIDGGKRGEAAVRLGAGMLEELEGLRGQGFDAILDPLREEIGKSVASFALMQVLQGGDARAVDGALAGLPPETLKGVRKELFGLVQDEMNERSVVESAPAVRKLAEGALALAETRLFDPGIRMSLDGRQADLKDWMKAERANAIAYLGEE